MANALKRGESCLRFANVKSGIKELLQSVPLGAVAYMDFKLVLLPESPQLPTSSQSRVGGPQGSQVQLTATNRQLADLSDVLTIDNLGNGPAIQIRDAWRCQDTIYANYTHVCYFQHTESRPVRFSNHIPVEGNIMTIWAREVSLQRYIITAPSDNIRLIIARSVEQAGRRRARSDSNREPTIKDMFKLLITSAASQLAQCQPRQ